MTFLSLKTHSNLYIEGLHTCMHSLKINRNKLLNQRKRQLICLHFQRILLGPFSRNFVELNGRLRCTLFYFSGQEPAAPKVSCFYVLSNGSFTLPDTDSDTETKTNTDKMCTEPNGNLHRSLSLSSRRTSTQFFYTSHFSLSVSVSVSSSVNTPYDLPNCRP